MSEAGRGGAGAGAPRTLLTIRFALLKDLSLVRSKRTQYAVAGATGERGESAVAAAGRRGRTGPAGGVSPLDGRACTKTLRLSRSSSGARSCSTDRARLA